jgi:hypothetical protein
MEPVRIALSADAKRDLRLKMNDLRVRCSAKALPSEDHRALSD